MATVKIYPLANNQMKYLQASKLFSIDSFSSWISTISATTISSVQYIKNDLEISINLDLSQTYAQPKQTIHYVSIQNAGEDTYYYYVKNTVWRSKSTVRLELVMDVLNTFKDGTDYTFKENTRITREHKDRFTVTTREIQFRWHITQQIGYLDVGDTVIIINDHGDTVFTGKIDSIDSYNCSIIITSNESADEIRQHLNDFIADPYEINKNGSNYYFVPGNWTKLIVTIFHEVPSILEKRQQEENLKKAKYKALKELTPYCELYTKLYHDEDDVCDYLMNELHNKGFKLPRKEEKYQTYSNIQGTYDDHYYISVVVYYNKEKVFEFPDKHSDSLIDIYYKCAYNIVSDNIPLGDWIPKFKEAINNANKYYNHRLDERIDNSVDEMIRRLTRG